MWGSDTVAKDESLAELFQMVNGNEFCGINLMTGYNVSRINLSLSQHQKGG
jgi:hypothetical protein